MTGLETIVEQILQEAQKEAEEIKAQAARNADSIIANGITGIVLFRTRKSSSSGNLDQLFFADDGIVF